jgi:hypothetical protein
VTIAADVAGGVIVLETFIYMETYVY